LERRTAATREATRAGGRCGMKLTPIYSTLPKIARIELDKMVASLRPLPWADRSTAFEGMWQAVLGHYIANATTLPAGHSPVLEYRMRLTVALERIWRGKVRTIDAAAWSSVSLHAAWQEAGREFLAGAADEMAAWGPKHPIF